MPAVAQSSDVKNTAAQKKAPAHPSGDTRFELLDKTLKRLRYQQDTLIEVLHSAQDIFGFVREDVLMYVAKALELPPSRVYGVATFYHLFSFKPKGEHSCTVFGYSLLCWWCLSHCRKTRGNLWHCPRADHT
jgi:bidirectional [NiFe] hydrogenase diaphorase subunit